MRTLKDFLLAEAKDDKPTQGDEDKIPQGFELIKNKGRLTDEAKLAMGGTFKSSMSSAQESSKVREKIRDGLNVKTKPNPKSVKDIIEKVILAQNDLDEIFKTKPKKEFGKDGIQVELKSAEWSKLAGRTSSSQRLLKFWLASSLIAYGYTDISSVSFSMSGNIIAIAG